MVAQAACCEPLLLGIRPEQGMLFCQLHVQAAQSKAVQCHAMQCQAIPQAMESHAKQCNAKQCKAMQHSPDVVYHGIQLNVLAFFILTLGFWQDLEEQIAAVKADLHCEVSTVENGKQNCGPGYS